MQLLAPHLWEMLTSRLEELLHCVNICSKTCEFGFLFWRPSLLGRAGLQGRPSWIDRGGLARLAAIRRRSEPCSGPQSSNLVQGHRPAETQFIESISLACNSRRITLGAPLAMTPNQLAIG